MSAAGIITVCLNPAIDRVIEVEGFAVGAHISGKELSLIPAGKAINVSRALSSLGVPSIATGFLGKDNSAVFAPVFRSGMIRDEFFQVPGRTRENVTLTDRASGVDTHVRDAGLQVDRHHFERLGKKLRLLTRDQAVVIFSGSLPPGMEAQDLLAMVEICAACGGRVAVDTSGPALAAMAGRKLWLVKPNAAELAQLAGRELGDFSDQLCAARDLTSHVQIVVFTRGSEGAYLFSRDQALHCHVPLEQERVRNTVGCGDVLLAALVGGIWLGRPLRQAFAEAVACASASACTPGTAEFQIEVFDELKTKVQIAEL